MTPTADEIQAAVSRNLGDYPFGGECIGVHKNQWDEWIADCHLWGPRNYGPFGELIEWFHKGDSNCPISQYMVVIDNHYTKILGYLSVRLWQAKDDMRLRTFVEDGGYMLDPNAPPSPYIVDPIKEYIKAHEKDPQPF